ncbi:MAG: tRNA glutamyl-Q(34) synthetase GluQRS [Oscillospiraceae bacterium]|nr:tRNA glutamyl-Q(34) synthetase GluQRS [Oscillospiraceae bacterium]
MENGVNGGRGLGRFAPTPSGRMHLGNVFSALIAWLSARSAGAEMLLRIEDLDAVRCSAENARLVRRDLLWLGLDWDCEQPPQSTRTGYYEEVLARLAAAGEIFPCWCTRGDLKNAPNAPHASDGHPIYPGTCRALSAAEREARSKEKPPLWRLHVPDETISFVDGHYGEYRENLARECGDFILRRADGVFAYQLAVTADDIAAGVTEVVRGRDLLSSTPRQLYLYRLLDAPAPRYAHVPLLTAPDGRRLSKRDRDLDLGVLRERFGPQEIIGRLACAAGLLDRPEPCTPRELIPLFAWEKIPLDDTAVEMI